FLSQPCRPVGGHSSPPGGAMTLRIVTLGIVALSAVVVADGAPPDTGSACEQLASLTISEGAITSATAVPAGEFALPGGRGGIPAPPLTVPAFCRVTATLKPTPESSIKIEVRLPAAERWNGKFLGTGNGGAGGAIAYAPLANGLQRGYATANTDMGTTTTGLDFSFGVGHPEMVKDWAYRSTHLMTVVAKKIVRALYDRDTRLSVFTPCSTGRPPGAHGGAALPGRLQRHRQRRSGEQPHPPACRRHLELQRDA